MHPTPPIPLPVHPPQAPGTPAPSSSFILPPSSFPTPLSPDDHATLLAIVSPDPNPDPASPPDPVLQAAFLARPDIQPHLAALAQLRALRDEITHQHRMGQAADLLLDIARKAEDIVEKRRAADALVRLLLGPSTRRDRTSNRTTNRSDTRADNRPPSPAAPSARPTSAPTAPPPMPPLPVPLPASFLALLPPDHPLRQPSPNPQTAPRPADAAGPIQLIPAPHNEPPAPFTYTTLAPPGLDPFPTTPHNHPPGAHALTLAAGAPQSHNTS